MAEQEDPRLGLAKEAAETTARYQAANVKMRERADNWGKSLTALGAAVVGYIGITKATDVFPVPPGWWWLPILTFVLLVVMAAAAIVVGWRLSRVARPIVMKLDPDAIPDVSEQERKEVAQLYLDQPSRDFTATTDRSASTPRDGTHCLTGTTDSATPSRHPLDSWTAVSRRAFPRSLQKPQTGLTSPTCRTPPGQNSGHPPDSSPADLLHPGSDVTL